MNSKEQEMLSLTLNLMYSSREIWSRLFLEIQKQLKYM